jgi:hypothetical protein
MKTEKECRHKWRVGSKNAEFIGKRIISTSINIWCEKCNKKIKASLYPCWRLKEMRKKKQVEKGK